MIHQQQGMARRWERHYPETRSTLASGLALFGAVILVVLGMIWPQKLSAEIFNSRLAYHLIMDLEDLWTCDKDYIRFIVDEPKEDQASLQFYFFNISNAAGILERGYKPRVQEVGPYAFRKKTYKYDVYFDPVDSLFVTYQEYILLEEVTEPEACSDMYARMGRHFLMSFDACLNGACNCRSVNETLTVLNPLFMKTIHDESAYSFAAYFSTEVFRKIKDLLEVDFVEAVKSHLVSNAFSEIMQFRTQMQFTKIVQTMVDSMQSNGKSLIDISAVFTAQPGNTKVTIPVSCNLTALDPRIADCPINGYSKYAPYLNSLLLTNEYTSTGYTFVSSDFPSLAPLFNSSWKYALVNTGPSGLSGWLGLGWQMGFISFNAPETSTMISDGDMDGWLNEVSVALVGESFRLGMRNFTADSVTDQVALLASKAMIKSVLYWMAPFFDTKFPYGSTYQAVSTTLAYKEFYLTAEPVQCSPLGYTCVWQWGYMRNLGNNHTFSAKSTGMIMQLIDMGTRVDTNPLHTFFTKNAASYYNNNLYCSQIRNQIINLDCTDIDFAIPDGAINVPSAYWGFDANQDITNRTLTRVRFANQNAATRSYYINVACNMSALLYQVYPKSTSFHDNYVIRYLNNHREKGFTHNFTSSNWKEIGWAQFGGGFVTYSITKVRAIYQVKRDAMWRFGDFDYYFNLIEFSSWCIKTGFPVASIFDVDDSKNLLYALSDRSDAGTDFRRHVVYVGSTLIGDGTFLENEVGQVGDRAFTPEANRGNFACNGIFSSTCNVLGVFYTSSSAFCNTVDAIFKVCRAETYAANPWVANCNRFETSITSPTSGIQCDLVGVYGKNHPYTKSRGNVLYEMMYTLTTNLRLRSGLWCRAFVGCDYSLGGFVTTTSVKQLLFEGYNEPSVIAYLNLKHENAGIEFSCVAQKRPSSSNCGVNSNPSRFLCDSSGLVMKLPAGQSKLLSYHETPKDEYFAPYFEVVLATGEMLWAFSSHPEKVKRAIAVKASGVSIIKVPNPHWAAFPALNTEDADFNKFYQCQNRLYGGIPNQLNSCQNRLNSGRVNISKSLDLEIFQGNDSIYWFSKPAVINGSIDKLQLPMELWDGFYTYPYTFNNTQFGTRHKSFQQPRIFHKTHMLNLILDQTQFVYDWEGNIDLAMPIKNGFASSSYKKSKILRVRRFEETATTWFNLRALGTPVDSFGMPYQIPIGMASLERFTGFPVFAGTPHAYGNLMWGGSEFDHVQGYEPMQVRQRSYVDYDPVTGKNIRQVVRQSVSWRRSVFHYRSVSISCNLS